MFELIFDISRGFYTGCSLRLTSLGCYDSFIKAIRVTAIVEIIQLDTKSPNLYMSMFSKETGQNKELLDWLQDAVTQWLSHTGELGI